MNLLSSSSLRVRKYETAGNGIYDSSDEVNLGKQSYGSWRRGTASGDLED